jgi:ribosomal protein L7/L12
MSTYKDLLDYVKDVAQREDAPQDLRDRASGLLGPEGPEALARLLVARGQTLIPIIKELRATYDLGLKEAHEIATRAVREVGYVKS